ncbi:Acylphosphatase-like domain-containing protein [Powellomyces hirtus]|nr:Acylphosphatase-like domain-containing protein [Powellomyces hirtus]
MTEIRQLIYLSQAVTPSSAALAAILDSARRRNERDQISGILLYNNGQFMQCLEGNHDQVGAVYNDIRKDDRHDHLAVLLDHTVSRRDFDCWLMGFKDVSLDRKFADNDDVIEAGFLQAVDNATKGVTLLASFARL